MRFITLPPEKIKKGRNGESKSVGNKHQKFTRRKYLTESRERTISLPNIEGENIGVSMFRPVFCNAPFRCYTNYNSQRDRLLLLHHPRNKFSHVENWKSALCWNFLNLRKHAPQEFPRSRLEITALRRYFCLASVSPSSLWKREVQTLHWKELHLTSPKASSEGRGAVLSRKLPCPAMEVSAFRGWGTSLIWTLERS